MSFLERFTKRTDQTPLAHARVEADRITIGNIFTEAPFLRFALDQVDGGLYNKDTKRRKSDGEKLIQSISWRSERDRQKYKFSQNKDDALKIYERSLEVKVDFMTESLIEKRVDEATGSKYSGDIFASSTMLLGIHYLMHRQHARLTDIAQRNNLGPFLNYAYRMREYKVTTSIAGLSIADVMNPEKDIDPTQFLRFLVESYLIGLGKDPKSSVEDNLAKSPEKYPMLTTYEVIDTASNVAFLYFTDPELIDKYDGVPNPIALEVKEATKFIISRLRKNTGNMQSLLMNPQSPQFEALKDAIYSYLIANSVSKKVALFFLFNGTNEYIKDLYRFAQRQVRIGSEANFYSMLATYIRQYLRESPLTQGILTKDDVDDFLEVEEVAEPVSLKELKARSQEISRLTRERNLVILPTTEVSKGLITPNAIYLHLDKNDSRKFTVVFRYRSGTGESEDIFVNVDGKKSGDGFEWSFIESPSEMPEIRNALLNAVRTVLLTFEHYLRRKKDKSPKQRLEKIETEEDTSKRKDKPSLISQLGSASKNSETKKQVSCKIDLPSKDNLESLLAPLQEKDRSNVMEGIQAFNERGAGKFRILIGRDKEGKPMYSLRTKSTVPGGIRVLLREVASLNSQRHFEIVTLQHRNRVFKRRLDIN